MEDSPNCSNSRFRYLCLTRAGRLRALGSHLFHPENVLLTHGGGPTHVRTVVESKDRATPNAEKMQPSVSNDARAIAQREEAVNNLKNDVPKFVTQARASLLLGISETELRRISNESGLGQLERAGEEEEIYFTYEELRQICQLAFPVHESH